MTVEFKGQSIANLEDWENLIFTGKKKKQWKEGRSAYSLADFILKQNDMKEIEALVAPVINGNFVLDKACPEYEARFDTYRHGREHDLGIWGKTEKGKTLFIGLEAKVDEPFGDTIATAYHKAKAKELNGKKTDAPKRIEELLNYNFSPVTYKDFDLRYQLLFSTAGTLCVEADIHILLVLVFKTDLYDPAKGRENQNDLKRFLKRAKAKKMTKGTYELNPNNQKLFLIYKEVEI